MNSTPASLADARQRDAADSLAGLAEEFHHPRRSDGSRYIYLCGHSLGLQPRRAADYIRQELEDWAHAGVLGHEEATRPWIPYHRHAAAPLAELVGAGPTEVVAMNSLTVNLHLMMTSFFRPAGARNTVMIEAGAFGSDRYAVVSQLHLHGLNEAQHLIELAPRDGERCLRGADILERIERESSRLALVLLPGVQYLTGQSFDLAAIIAAARRAGAVAAVDLAHAVGNTELRLHDWNADFAVWCSYKYLNAGPGATGGCFVHERHGRRFDLPRLAGWWGHDPHTRFAMGPQFHPVAGAEGALRRKSEQLTAWLEDAIKARCGEHIEIITPADPAQRGCQLSLRVKRTAQAARQFHARLSAAGVLADWRDPDIIRVAPVPLYNSFTDCHHAVQALVAALHA
jgi:kynureninase